MNPVSEIDAGLSYERDIAPLQQRFFRDIYSNRSIRPQDRAALSMGISQRFAGVFEQQAKLRELDQQARNRELSFQSGMFALDQAREKAIKERENAEALGSVTNDLINITNPSADSETQRSALSQWAINNANTLATNDAARLAYDAAIRGMAKPKETLTDVDVVRMGIPLEELDVNMDGVVDESERTPVRVSGVATSRRKQELEARLAEKERTRALKEINERNAARQGIIDRSLAGLSTVQFATVKPFSEAGESGEAQELDKYKNAGMASYVDSTIAAIGGPKAVAAAAAKKLGPKARFDLALKLKTQYESDALTPPGEGIADSFTK